MHFLHVGQQPDRPRRAGAAADSAGLANAIFAATGERVRDAAAVQIGIQVGVKFAAALAAGATVIGVRVAASAVQAGAPKTTKDRIYSSAQATRGEAIYTKLCDTCHDPAKVKPGMKGGPVLSGDVFLTKWDGKDLDELLDEIEMNMPNDGSAVLDDKQTADVTAYILKTNGMPDGASELAKGAGSKGITIAK